MDIAYASQARSVLLKVPLERIRTLDLHGFPAHADSHSPFIKTLQDYLEGRCTSYAGSELESFYATCRPKTAAGYLRLLNSENRWLHEMPALAAVAPWHEMNPHAKIKTRPFQIEAENREHGRFLGAVEGNPVYGPVSQKKGQLEFERLARITQEIRRNGWRTDRRGIDNPIVIALLHGDDYRFIISGAGQHRIAALAALEYDEAVVQMQTTRLLGGLVRRSEAKWWPLVSRGWFDEQDARAVFDRIFQGLQ